MTKINIVYDDEFEDADIIAIPDKIVSSIGAIVREFLEWVPSTDDENYWSEMNGRKILAVETDGFLKWLNSSYCSKSEKAYVVSQHTTYCSEYPIIEF